MSMVIIGKKSLLALFVLGSMQLIAMECNTLQKSENVLLVLKWQQMLENNITKYRKKFYLKFQCLPHDELYKPRQQLAFFENSLLKLNNEIKDWGKEVVGATIAYNMQQNKYKRFTV